MLVTAWHYLFFVLAGLSLGMAAALTVRIHRQLREVGDHSHELLSIPNGLIAFSVPKAYLKSRARHGWSAWPAYGIWLCSLLALLFGIIGVTRM
jgi:hypothetical protein